MCHTIALFGEAEKGDFHSLLFFSYLPLLAETLGHPPEGSHGLHLAIQTLMFKREIIYIRVKEEGFSIRDYMQGLQLLKQADNIKKLSAICMPGVGNGEIINQAVALCAQFHCVLMTTERDFYDYLTCIHSA
jgi:hypothetical protein